MARTQRNGVGCPGQVPFVGAAVLCVYGIFESCYFLLCFGLEFVQFHAYLLFHFGRYVSEISHQCIQASFFA